MAPCKEVRGCLALMIVEEQELPNAAEVQPEREVTHAKFRETVWILSHVVNHQVEHRGYQ